MEIIATVLLLLQKFSLTGGLRIVPLPGLII